MMSQLLIIDTDLGIDDAIAIMLALKSPEIEVMGISAVAGNFSVDTVIDNIFRILGFMDRLDIPVFKGAYRPLLGEHLQIHEAYNDFTEVGLEIPYNVRVQDKHPAQFIHEITREHPGNIVLVTIGPLTNVALALLLYPEIQDDIKFMVSMCGSYGVTKYGVGSITSRAEFNVYSDPLAAKIVLLSDIKKYLIGLDVTQKPSAKFKRKEIYKFGKLGKVGKLIKNLYRDITRDISIHDPMAIAYLIEPKIFKFKPLYVDVELYGEYTFGETIADMRNDVPEWLRYGKKANVCVDINGDKYKELLIERLRD